MLRLWNAPNPRTVRPCSPTNREQYRRLRDRRAFTRHGTGCFARTEGCSIDWRAVSKPRIFSAISVPARSVSEGAIPQDASVHVIGRCDQQQADQALAGPLQARRLPQLSPSTVAIMATALQLVHGARVRRSRAARQR